MDRIIEVKVGGNYLTKDNKNAGVQHEAGVTSLRISFDEGWDGYAKKVTWWDAKGLNPVETTLTTNLLEDVTVSTRVYIVPIPKEPLAEAGMCTFVIDGYVSGKRMRSVSDKLYVKEAPFVETAGQPTDPTPTQAEQLQAEIDSIQDTIQSAAANAAAAATSATNAANSAATASVAATNALNSRVAAESSANAAAGSADAAAASQSAAAASAAAAAASEAAAKTSETAAKESETAAEGFKNYAQTAAETAAVKSGNAALSEQNAAASASDAAASASAAQTAKAGSEAAQSAIENMSVEAVTLAAGSSATVTKGTDSSGNVKLTYGIPTGPQGPKGERGPQGPAGSGTGDMTASVYDPTGKAQDIFAYVDANSGGGVAVVNTTSTDGVSYTGTIDGVTALATGMVVVMIPDKTSTTTTPTLNISGIGARQIVRRLSSIDTSANPEVIENCFTVGSSSGWIAANRPYLLVYYGSMWVEQGMTRPSSADLNGTVYPRKGGTGKTSLTSGSYLVGNGTNAVNLKTPAEVLTDIGAAASDHTHTAADVGADPSGSAAAVQVDLGTHTGNKNNPHGVTAEQVGAAAANHSHTPSSIGAAPAYTYGTEDLTAGTSTLETGKLYFVYE